MAELAQDLSVLMLAAVCSRPTEVLMMALSRDDPTEEPPSELWATVVVSRSLIVHKCPQQELTNHAAMFHTAGLSQC